MYHIQQHDDDGWAVGCYIWYREEGPLLAVPNVIANTSTASLPTSYYSMWHYNSQCLLKGYLYPLTLCVYVY